MRGSFKNEGERFLHDFGYVGACLPNESGTGDNRAATSVHRACRDSARRWRRHRLRQGALALLEPGFAFCILHAAERRHSASRYPRAPGVSPTQSWGQRDRVENRRLVGHEGQGQGQCIYMGTHQLFPAFVLTTTIWPSPMILVPVGHTVHLVCSA